MCTSYLAGTYLVWLGDGDGLQPPRQGLHEAHQVLNLSKACLNLDFTGQFVVTYF